MRGGTAAQIVNDAIIVNFNPPSPCGEGLLIHFCPTIGADFNPPSPCGEGRGLNLSCIKRFISIHPPRAGRDAVWYAFADSIPYFNPPSPCGEGLRGVVFRRSQAIISIHPPRAGRDLIDVVALVAIFISIHPPRAGRDADIGSAVM